MSEWRPIHEAPQNGSKQIVGWENGNWAICIWKTNDRIVSAQKNGQLVDCRTSYWGDPAEWDDYDLALAVNAPSFWLPVPPVPETR